MGSLFAAVWPPEIIDEVEQAFRDAVERGYATTTRDAPFFLTRNGYLEETYFDYNMIPVREENGHIEGFYNVAFETTRQHLSDRRTKTLISMATLPDVASFWQKVLEGFESNEFDIPLAVVYSCSKCSKVAGVEFDFTLQADLGLTKGSVVLHSSKLGNGGERFLPLLKQSQTASTDTVVFQRREGRIPREVLENLKWRGFGEAPNTIVVMKFAAGDAHFSLLLALNPRKAFDDDYKYFLQLLSNQLSTSLTSAELLQQANANQATLSRQVAEGERRFRSLTELNPMGIYIISPLGELLYGNDTCRLGFLRIDNVADSSRL